MQSLYIPGIYYTAYEKFLTEELINISFQVSLVF